MRHLFLSLLLIVTMNVHCQQRGGYEIFKTTGNISNASTGLEVKKGDAVEPVNKLIIGNGSKVGILDRKQNCIYYSQSQGTHSVASIMRDAKRKADNAVAAVNSEVLNRSNRSNKGPKVSGVSFRGSEAENMYLQSVCNALFGITMAQPDNRLTLRKVRDDDAFYFSMTNDTDSLLFVNVMAVRSGETPQLCLNVGMAANQPYVCVAPKSQLELPEFLFADCDSTDYYMFGTFEPVDSQALSLLLNTGDRCDEVEDCLILVSPKITAGSNE